MNFQIKTNQQGKCFDLSTVQDESWFLDFEIEFQDEDFTWKGNKLVFATQSRYFKEKLTNNNNRVIIENGDGIEYKMMVMESVTKFFTFGEIDFDDRVIEYLMKFSKLIDQEDLFRCCVVHISNNINEENFIKYRKLGLRYDLEKIIKSTKVFAEINFNKIYEEKLFLEMEDEFMESILKSDTIDVKNEEHMFFMLDQWLEYDWIDRMQFYEEFIELIHMKDLTTEFLEKHINALSEKYSKPQYDYLIKFTPDTPRKKPMNIEEIKENFEEAIERDEFLNLTKVQLMDMLKSDDVFVNTEEIIYYGVKKWIEYDEESRMEHLADFLQHIRWENLTTDFIFDKSDESTVKKKSAMYFKALKGDLNDELIIKKSRKRKRTLFVVGDWRLNNACKIEFLNNVTNKWEFFHDLKLNITEFSSVILDANLITIGAFEENKKNKVWSFDLINKQSTQLPSLNVRRFKATTTVINGSIYVCGGHSGLDALKSIETWNPSASGWKLLSSMRYKKYFHSSTEWNGKLFVFGGLNQVEKLNSVEIYNPESDKWTEGTPMRENLSYCAITVLKDLIYLMGGFNESEYSKSVHVYNPKSNQWTSTVDLPNAISGSSSIVIGDKIILSGGFDGTKYDRNVYEFDPNVKVWKVHSSILNERRGHSLMCLS